MKNHFRILFSFLPEKIERSFYRDYFSKEHEKHPSNNSQGVSHLTKQKHLLRIVQETKISQLVETGTYLGDMLFMLAHDFKKLYSIELSEFYYNKAKKRFINFPTIELHNGDSGEVLKAIIDKIKEPTLFWLDGHYSGGKTALGKKECPIFEELKHIFKSNFNHVIVIDDARLFIGKNDYPEVKELKEYIEQNTTIGSYEIVDDAIVVKLKK